MVAVGPVMELREVVLGRSIAMVAGGQAMELR